MLNGLWGRPRSGKSYEAVRYHIIPALVSGRMVVTNIPLDIDKLAQIYGDSIRDLIVIVKANFTDYGSVRPFSVPQDFEKYDWRNDQGVGPLFVVDEAHLSLGRDCKPQVREYASMHGHYGHDIILVSQSPQKIHKDIKDMVEVSWRCVKMSVYGDDDKYIKKTYHGVTTRNSDSIHEEERFYDKQFFPFYQSHTQSKTAIVEAVSEDIKAQLFPHKKKLIVVFIICSIFAVIAGYSAVTSSDISKKSDVKSDDVKIITKQSLKSNPFELVESVPLLNSSKPKPKKKSINQLLIEEKKRRSNEVHPFSKVNLHIVGKSDYMDGNHYVNEVYFYASKSNRYVFDLKISDLLKAGYDVQVLSDCVIKLSYFDYEEYIICDAPERYQNKEIKSEPPLIASSD
ncbi:MAG: zonular occludens toxin [Gammaproteobacteria bacterium]|nr:hypothetical protein [Pseudomonas sp.]PCI54391.1 MAG: zonular occludens toxin [Gammaproteobacteria bacterium]